MTTEIQSIATAPAGRAGARQRWPEWQLALSALLVATAFADGDFGDSEREVIVRLLERRFDLTRSLASELVLAGERAGSGAQAIPAYVEIAAERASPAQRTELIEMLWEVAFADGILDENEDRLLHRIGGLVSLSERELASGRQHVTSRLGLVNADNPWPGLKSFSEACQEFFHGRDAEIDELLRLVRREFLTVLFGRSGLGKTSLLNAGLFPRLRKQNFLPIYIRLDPTRSDQSYSDQVKDRINHAYPLNTQ